MSRKVKTAFKQFVLITLSISDNLGLQKHFWICKKSLKKLFSYLQKKNPSSEVSKAHFNPFCSIKLRCNLCIIHLGATLVYSFAARGRTYCNSARAGIDRCCLVSNRISHANINSGAKVWASAVELVYA